VTVRATGLQLPAYLRARRQGFLLPGAAIGAAGALGRKPQLVTVIAPGERSAIRVHFSVGTI